MLRHCSCTWRDTITPYDENPRLRFRVRYRSNLGRSFASFSAGTDMLVYGLRALIALIIRGWLRVYHRFEIIGHENLRTNRSLVIVANHSSHLDTLCSCGAAFAGTPASRFSSRGSGLFFSKRAAHFHCRNSYQCAALCVAFAEASPSARNFSTIPKISASSFRRERDRKRGGDP